MKNKKIELIKNILINDNIVDSINDNINVLIEYIPEIKFMVRFDHKNPHHHLDVWDHTLYALSLSECDFDVRLALLLHDIGKPFSYQEGEIRHFHEHPKISSYILETILNRLGFEKNYINKICYLIENHDIIITNEDIIDNYDLQLKRFKVQRCDALAHHPDKLEKRKDNINKSKILFNKGFD
ncbi:MAG: HD domain-containing protein [Bacilli bacterium]|nr:HD domain-containing protein [Bacilli bacterium]